MDFGANKELVFKNEEDNFAVMRNEPCQHACDKIYGVNKDMPHIEIKGAR